MSRTFRQSGSFFESGRARAGFSIEFGSPNGGIHGSNSSMPFTAWLAIRSSA